MPPAGSLLGRLAGRPDLLVLAGASALLGLLVATGVLTPAHLITVPVTALLGWALGRRLQRWQLDHFEGHVHCAARLPGPGPGTGLRRGWLIPRDGVIGFHPAGPGRTERAARSHLPHPLPPVTTRPPTPRERWSSSELFEVAALTTVDGRAVEVAVRPEDLIRLGREGQPRTNRS